MEKQNAIILGMQHAVTGALQDFARKLYDLTVGKNVPLHTATSHHTPYPSTELLQARSSPGAEEVKNESSRT
jgi:hypothetical protein